MIDFSFLQDTDIIIINDESELHLILFELDKFGICWASGLKASVEVWEPVDSTESIRYIRIFKTCGICYIRYGTKAVFPDRTFAAHEYTVQEVLFLAGQESKETEDSESFEEIDIREFLSI